MFVRLQTAHRVVAQVLDPADEMRDLARDPRDVPLGLDHVEPGPREGARRVRRRRVVDLVQVAVVRRPPAVSRLRCKLEGDGYYKLSLDLGRRFCTFLVFNRMVQPTILLERS